MAGCGNLYSRVREVLMRDPILAAWILCAAAVLIFTAAPMVMRCSGRKGAASGIIFVDSLCVVKIIQKQIIQKQIMACLLKI